MVVVVVVVVMGSACVLGVRKLGVSREAQDDYEDVTPVEDLMLECMFGGIQAQRHRGKSPLLLELGSDVHGRSLGGARIIEELAWRF